MKHVDPASPDFEALPRNEQAKVYRSLGWTMAALKDEFGVSENTIRIWTIPGEKEKRAASHRAYRATAKGRETRSQWHLTPAGQASHQRKNEKRRAESSLRSQAKQGKAA